MRVSGFLLSALVLAACAPANRDAPAPVPVDLAAPPERATAPVRLDVALSGETLESPPPGLDALKEGQTVWISLTLPLGQLPSVRRGEVWETLSPDCGHSAVRGLDEISLPTGYNHLIVSVLPGEASRHAANLVACDYAPAPDGAGEDVPHTRVRVTGCFLVHDVSIPTARELVLHPRAAEACGL